MIDEKSMDRWKCSKCGREVLRCVTEDGKFVDLEVSGAVYTYAERPVDGGHLAKVAKVDPSKRIGIKHACVADPAPAQKK